MGPKTQNLALITVLILLSMTFKESGGCRLLGGGFEESWMKTGNLFLSSLQKGPVRPPGNGCDSTGNGGSSCIGSKKIVGGHHGGALPPPPPLIPSLTHAYPQHMVQFGATDDGK
ncbi:hypothetical protein L2E82_00255 [Cichorium intybus]|uniref:Uncharacterized protein n=1 Tax=Cichorium intybus TaxID=13427 RepID=A0ACB9GXI8_CICIN|nr:hypothetical protein L2E82_00255 [Cichorium intybus]